MELKKLRQEKGYTQIELASKVGVTLNAYIKWEKGANKPTAENMNKLKEVLGIEE